jgi:hypothetical protein
MCVSHHPHPLGCAAAVQRWSSYRIHAAAATRPQNLAQLASFRILRK